MSDLKGFTIETNPITAVQTTGSCNSPFTAADAKQLASFKAIHNLVAEKQIGPFTIYIADPKLWQKVIAMVTQNCVAAPLTPPPSPGPTLPPGPGGNSTLPSLEPCELPSNPETLAVWAGIPIATAIAGAIICKLGSKLNRGFIEKLGDKILIKGPAATIAALAIAALSKMKECSGALIEHPSPKAGNAKTLTEVADIAVNIAIASIVAQGSMKLLLDSSKIPTSLSVAIARETVNLAPLAITLLAAYPENSPAHLSILLPALALLPANDLIRSFNEAFTSAQGGCRSFMNIAGSLIPSLISLGLFNSVTCTQEWSKFQQAIFVLSSSIPNWLLLRSVNANMSKLNPCKTDEEETLKDRYLNSKELGESDELIERAVEIQKNRDDFHKLVDKLPKKLQRDEMKKQVQKAIAKYERLKEAMQKPSLYSKAKSFCTKMMSGEEPLIPDPDKITEHKDEIIEEILKGILDDDESETLENILNVVDPVGAQDLEKGSGSSSDSEDEEDQELRGEIRKAWESIQDKSQPRQLAGLICAVGESTGTVLLLELTNYANKKAMTNHPTCASTDGVMLETSICLFLSSLVLLSKQQGGLDPKKALMQAPRAICQTLKDACSFLNCRRKAARRNGAVALNGNGAAL
jgi:hypothetical protein